MALIVHLKDKSGKSQTVRVGTDDEVLARQLVELQNPGVKVEKVVTEVPESDGPVVVETFAAVKTWVDAQAEQAKSEKKIITNG